MANRVVIEELSTAPVEDADLLVSGDAVEEDLLRGFRGNRRRVVAFVVFVVLSLAFLYYFLPQLAGLDETWKRIEHGDPWWMAVAFGFEVLSIGAYILMFHAVCARGYEDRIGFRESYEINMAGLAATRLFAAGGAGGVALTAWAMRRAGMDRRIVACRMVAFLVLMYAVYMAALIIGGIGLRTGLFPGSAPFGVTVVPAIFGGVVFVLVMAMALVPEGFERRAASWARGHRRARWARRAATVPASIASGVRTAIFLLRSRNASLLSAIGWWGFNIAVLWACFHAFGDAPPTVVLIMGYFVGMLGNLIPSPGGIGGVDGGMIGAYLAFGVDGGLAVVAVLAYRAFAFWLPTVPGAVAWFQLRRTVARWREEPVAA